MHEHTEKLIFEGEPQSFSLQYPFLFAYFSRTLKLKFNKIILHESGCDEGSCPVEETTFTFIDPTQLQKSLRVPRNVDSISKMDLHLAVKKQWSHE